MLPFGRRRHSIIRKKENSKITEGAVKYSFDDLLMVRVRRYGGFALKCRRLIYMDETCGILMWMRFETSLKSDIFEQYFLKKQ